jgi:hypothetical protein
VPSISVIFSVFRNFSLRASKAGGILDMDVMTVFS